MVDLFELPTLLYGCETWAGRAQDKYRITSGEMKFVRNKAQYTQQDYKTSEDRLSELKMSPFVMKIQNYRNKGIKHVRRMEGDRQTATPNYGISTMWETKPRTTPQKTSRVLMGPEQVTRPKTL